jgi:hypothetical protein
MNKTAHLDRVTVRNPRTASAKRSEILTVPPPSADEVIDVVEPDRADQDEIDRDNIVQQSRHQQNQYPASEGSERQEMGDGPHHYGGLSPVELHPLVSRSASSAPLARAMPGG